MIRPVLVGDHTGVAFSVFIFPVWNIKCCVIADCFSAVAYSLPIWGRCLLKICLFRVLVRGSEWWLVLHRLWSVCVWSFALAFLVSVPCFPVLSRAFPCFGEVFVLSGSVVRFCASSFFLCVCSFLGLFYCFCACANHPSSEPSENALVFYCFGDFPSRACLRASISPGRTTGMTTELPLVLFRVLSLRDCLHVWTFILGAAALRIRS